MQKTPPVSQALTAKGIPHTVFRHEGNLTSLQQAAQERNQEPQQVVRSLLFRESKESYLMVLIAGPDQIDWKKLRRHIGTSRITMASRSEVQQITGYELGAVAPFGLPQPIPILVDPSVLEQKEISMGSGIRNVAVILSSDDLFRALPDAEVIELKE